MKLLALDIGNVCVKIDFRNFARALGLQEIPPALIDLQRDLECGRVSDEAFIYAVSQYSHRTPEYAMDAFNSILIEAVPGMTELIAELDQYGFEARFFSDISLTHLCRTFKLFDSAAFVPDGMYSFVSGAQKPAPEMFAAFEEKFGIPDLYTDDRAELIDAALKRNWNAVQFTSAENLKQALLKQL